MKSLLKKLFKRKESKIQNLEDIIPISSISESDRLPDDWLKLSDENKIKFFNEYINEGVKNQESK